MNDSCRQCAIACVSGQTLEQYLKQYQECDQDFDLLFSRDTGDPDFYRKVVAPGRVYETGYPRCICWKAGEGSQPCECSRQALLYLYSQMAPEKKIAVEKVQTVREGAENCIFRVILGE